MESKVNYGQEFGPNLIKIAKKLLKNPELCRLLVYTDLEPLSNLHKDIQNPMELFGKNVRVVPLIEPVDETTESKVVIVFGSGAVNEDNTKFENIEVLIYVYCPYKEWLISGDSIRPHAIMSEIRKSLQDVRINGLGEIRYEGFQISSLTSQMGSHLMRFRIGTFS